jgi:hypothetical protein
MKKLFFLLTIVSFLIVSCEKENVNSSNSDIDNYKPTVNSTLSTEDKIQYFNSLGEEHNEVLYYIGNNIDVSEATQEQRFNLACSYLDDYSYTFEEFLEDYPVVDEILNNPSNTANLLFTDEDIPCNLSSYYNSLGEIFAYCRQKANDSIEVSPAEFDAMVVDLENSVYDNYSVDIDPVTNIGDEASIFLGACAIARHSYMFWNDAVNDETHPW